ncbi:hypothetical protein H4R35_006977, partial [Dimargaris xerosporica]
MMKKIQPSAHLAAPQVKAPPLDFASVRTAYNEPPPLTSADSETRHFGLPEAPVFYPTPEEFVHPLKYIEKIRPVAEQAGICKIIPPTGWRPPFALDTETFRFHTRKQQLNSLEGKTRANLNYLEQLYKFHAQQGHPVTKIPQLAKRPIDLYALKKEVALRGGYRQVTANKKWAEIGRVLKYARETCTSLSNSLKKAYCNILLPYEDYMERHKPQLATPKFEGRANAAMSSHPPADRTMAPPSSPTGSAVSEVPSRQSPSVVPGDGDNNGTPDGDASTPGSRRRSKRLKIERKASMDLDTHLPLASPPIKSAPLTQRPMSPQTPLKTPTKRSLAQSETADECQVCGSSDHGEQMLLCDGCDHGFHMHCLDPPLKKVPKSDWYCLDCVLKAGEDFGFEEGSDYSLQAFQAKCNAFKRQWFASYYETATADELTEDKVPERVVEAEFWRLVDSPYEEVEVEYGADLHSMQHGSAFPTKERNPLDPYSLDPWNLNVIPILPESLFSYIKSDISGMMNPWLYVGMCFSTFCWHNEDHYTYSINYMHWGDTKTWYGIPGSNAEKFENTLRNAVPELFEQQPDLLFQLVTMLSPATLVKNQVEVYGLDQRPGQLVVTFPKAYHAGFNQGFNFAEAVNFALPDWLSFGLDGVQRYQAYHRLPVFSHDELLMTIATSDSLPVAKAEWLLPHLQVLLSRELDARDAVRSSLGQTLHEQVEAKDYAEEEY